MNKYYLIFLFTSLFYTTAHSQINVTVSVDMAGITVHPSGVHIVGTFNGWDPNATMMTETAAGSNVFEAVINGVIDDNIEYKILNGNFYERGPNMEGEEPTSDCSYEYNGNRVFTIPMQDAVLPTFAFGGCPPGVTRIPLTFRIDASGQDVSQGVWVVGEMTGFNNDGFRQMSLIGGEGVYAVTIDVPADLLRVNFKYSLGNNFGGAENTVPAPCANPVNSDRFYRFTGGVEETEVFLFNTCEVSLALPVELTGFTAYRTGKQVMVNWQTAVEDDVDYFLVERSADGINFNYLKTVAAAINGQRPNTYEVRDDTPLSGVNYYRLTTVDLDGTTHLEGVRTVLVEEGITAAKLYPNPVTDQLTVAFRGSGKVTILDGVGRILHTAVATDGHSWPGVANLPTGRYYLQLVTDTGNQTIPFIK